MKKLLLSLIALLGIVATTNIYGVDFYVIGNDVNGNSWTLASPDAKMTDKGNGIYEWEGETLGTGFKINDGTWNNTDLGDGVIANLGGNSENLVIGEPYYFETGGTTGNINFADATQLIDPTVTLDMNDLTVTVTAKKVINNSNWYLTGTFYEWTMDETNQMTKAADGTYRLDNLKISGEGFLKIVLTYWADQYSVDRTYSTISIDKDAGNLVLKKNISDDGIPYALDGVYTFIMNPTKETLSWRRTDKEPEDPAYATGTKDAPLSVNDLLKRGVPEIAIPDCWVTGYIVGCFEDAGGASFKAPFTCETNLLIAESGSERDEAKCIPVQLPAGHVRNALNLAAYPNYLGRQVVLKGSNEAYFSVNGLKNVTEYKFVDEDTPVTPVDPEYPFLATQQFISATNPDVKSSYDVIYMQKQAMEELRNTGAKVQDLSRNSSNQKFLIWDESFTIDECPVAGIGFNGYDATEYASLTVTDKGWSTCHFGSDNTQSVKWNDNTHLRLSYRTNGPAPESVALIIAESVTGGAATVAIGTDSKYGNSICKSIAPAPSFEWQTIDITFGQLRALCPDFIYNYNSTGFGNILEIRAGGEKDTNICFDAIYLYNPDPSEDPLIYNGLVKEANDWTFEEESLPEGITQVWSWGSDNRGCLSASANVDGKAYSVGSVYAVSPIIDLMDVTEASVSFDHAAESQTMLRDYCALLVREARTDKWYSPVIPTWPEAGSWEFVNSGNIDLSDFVGKRIELAFVYASDEVGADTWKVRNVKVINEKGIETTFSPFTPYTPSEPVTPPTPPTPTPIVIEDEYDGLCENADGWTFENVNIPEEIDNVWAWNNYKNGGYLKASAFADGKAYQANSYAVSPEIDLSKFAEAYISFEHAAKYQTTFRDFCGLSVREAGTTTSYPLTIPVWPDAGSWVFANSGDISLADYIGKKVQIIFAYASNESGADDWEIKNFKLRKKKSDSSVAMHRETAPEVKTLRGKAVINGLSEGDEITVYNMAGQVITSAKASTEYLEIFVPNEKVIIVRVNDKAVKAIF